MAEDLAMLKISFLEYGNVFLDTSWKGQTFYEDHARLYCVTEGSAEIWHGGRHFEMLPGRLFLVPPAAGMRFRCRRSCKILWLHFTLLLHGDTDIFAANAFTAVHVETEGLPLIKRFLELLELLGKSGNQASLRAQGILLELVSFFIPEELSGREPKELALLERFKPVMECMDRSSSEKLSLERLSALAGYEKTYFSVLFKKTFRVSPLQYAMRRRIEKAQALLSCSDAKLSLIAQECGFSDEFHLSKTFKRIAGRSPREFRRSLSRKMP